MALMIDNNRVEFLGIEIIFTGEDDPRGSIWINFNETLSLLYGKNGAGKSTILTAVTAFMEGKSLEDDGLLLHGYARLVDPTRSCSIIDQSIKSMPDTPFLVLWEGLETSGISAEFEISRAALDLPYNKWEPSLFGATPDSWEDLDMDWSKFVSHYLFLGLWEHEFEYDLPAVRTFAQHLIDERVFCLRPTGQKEEPEWHVSLAANLDKQEIRDAYEHLLQDNEFFEFEEITEHHVSQILLDVNILANRSDMPRTSAPFVSAARIANQKITSLGISVVDLNEEIDLEEWTKRRIAEIVHSGWVKIDDPWFADYQSPTSTFESNRELEEDSDEEDETEVEVDGETVWSVTFGATVIPVGWKILFEFVGERYVVLQKALTFIAKELPEELAISDLRIVLQRDLGLWIFDQPGVLEAYDKRSENWIPVSSTSSATQKIIGMALKIHSDIRSSRQVAIAVGDEIDQGLHTLAINGLYKMLSDSIPTCFVATHSSTALSTRLGERLHVHRGVNGEVLVSHIGNSDFLLTSASSFGVKVNELIGMIDLVVAVEGLHDKLVLEHFIKLDERLQNSNILIISMTGVNNATNLVNADFLLSFTDLRILAIADNTSKTDLQATWLSTNQQLRLGQSPSQLAKSLRARANTLRKQRWHEQHCMIELLAAATQSSVLSRLRMGGHTYADIEMALDPKYFGLDKEWLTLEAEFKVFKADTKSEGKNFKDFLRSVYSVSIDQRTIEAALSMTQGTPSDIKLIIDDIVANAFHTDLLQELF